MSAITEGGFSMITLRGGGATLAGASLIILRSIGTDILGGASRITMSSLLLFDFSGLVRIIIGGAGGGTIPGYESKNRVFDSSLDYNLT